MSLEFVESEIAHLGPILLPRVRHDRPTRPWWEAARLHSMFHYLNLPDAPPQRVLDVGAEMGDMSALFALWGCDVFLVEPNPKAWPWIQAHFEANDLHHCGWFTGLPGDSPTMTAEFGLHPDDAYNWPSFAADAADPETGFYHLDEHGGVAAPVMTLDQLVAETGFIPTAITVDIEGGEARLLEGMTETLREHRPRVWMSIHPEFMRDRYGIGGPVDFVLDYFRTQVDYEPVFLAKDHEEHWMFLPKEEGWVW